MKKISYLSFLILFLYSTAYSQNKLDKSKQELNSSSSRSTQTSSSSFSSSKKKSKNESPNLFADLFVDLFVYTTYGAVKYGIVGDYKNENHLHSSLTPYPFYNNQSGNFESTDTVSIKKNLARIDLENSFVYSNNTLYGNHLKAKIRPSQYFYFQTDFHQLFEFNDIDHTSSRLSLFHFNFCYDRIRLEKFNFGWTLGASYVGNEVRKAGFSYGLTVDYFLNKRISFSGAAKWSSINSSPVNSLELQSKFHRKNYFFSLGYENLKIASPSYNLIALGGGIYF